MHVDRLVTISNAIGHKEHQRVLDILKYYAITPKNIEKIRSVYKIVCEDKNYCLKKVSHGDTKALKGMQLVSYLKSRGFDNVADYIKTKDGKECVKHKKVKYYLTEWIEGRECDFNTIEELKRAVVLLAEFHIKSEGFYHKGIKMDSNHKNWPNKLQAYKADLYYFKKLIETKKIKSVFDIEYNNNIDTFIELMDMSMNLLNKSNYINISKIAKQRRCVCHDSYYYQNVLVSNENKMYIIDLDSTIYDINLYDLAKFIRRILHKKVYGWRFEVAQELINTYSSVNKLTFEEYEILLAFIIFPHKYWKLGSKRYYKSKKWNEEKYLKRLYRIEGYLDIQKKFVEDYCLCYGIELNAPK